MPVNLVQCIGVFPLALISAYTIANAISINWQSKLFIAISLSNISMTNLDLSNSGIATIKNEQKLNSNIAVNVWMA